MCVCVCVPVSLCVPVTLCPRDSPVSLCVPVSLCPPGTQTGRQEMRGWLITRRDQTLPAGLSYSSDVQPDVTVMRRGVGVGGGRGSGDGR